MHVHVTPEVIHFHVCVPIGEGEMKTKMLNTKDVEISRMKVIFSLCSIVNCCEKVLSMKQPQMMAASYWMHVVGVYCVSLIMYALE